MMKMGGWWTHFLAKRNTSKSQLNLDAINKKISKHQKALDRMLKVVQGFTGAKSVTEAAQNLGVTREYARQLSVEFNIITDFEIKREEWRRMLGEKPPTVKEAAEIWGTGMATAYARLQSLRIKPAQIVNRTREQVEEAVKKHADLTRIAKRLNVPYAKAQFLLEHHGIGLPLDGKELDSSAKTIGSLVHDALLEASGTLDAKAVGKAGNTGSEWDRSTT